MCVAIKELSRILLVGRRRAVVWTRQQARGGGWGGGRWGSQGCEEGPGSRPVHHCCCGPSITHREEIRGLWTFRKGNGPSVTMVCFQHPQAKREPTLLPTVTFILQRPHATLSLGLQRGPGGGTWGPDGMGRGPRLWELSQNWIVGEKDRVDGKESGVLSREEGKMCPLKAKVQQKGDGGEPWAGSKNAIVPRASAGPIHPMLWVT